MQSPLHPAIIYRVFSLQCKITALCKSGNCNCKILLLLRCPLDNKTSKYFLKNE